MARAARALKPREIAFLRVLAAADGALYAGRVFVLAYPNAPYKGRRDAGATRTLDVLQNRGLVAGRYGSYYSSGSRDWRITDEGREALAEIEGGQDG